MRLKTYCVQKYHDPIRVGQASFKNTVEVPEPAVVDYHFITRIEFIDFHDAITSYLRPHHFNDLVINRNRLVVDTDQTMNSSGITHSVIDLVVFETAEDITREQRLYDLRQPTRELIELINSQPGIQSFNSPGP